VALHYHGNAKPQDNTTVVDQPKTPLEQPHKAIVTITESDGTILTVDADSLVWGSSLTPREFTLNGRQSIPFDKIKTIDVLEVEDMTTTVQVTLTDGRTLKGVVDGGHTDRGMGFEGKSDIGGHVRVRIGLLRQILFQR